MLLQVLLQAKEAANVLRFGVTFFHNGLVPRSERKPMVEVGNPHDGYQGDDSSEISRQTRGIIPGDDLFGFILPG